MKNKIITALLFLICIMFIVFQGKALSRQREAIKSLEQEKRVFERQIRENLQDQQKRNQEINDLEKKTQKLKDYAKTIDDKCLHTIIPIDFSGKLREGREMQ